ncbi:MAG: hypothetical protein IKA02_06490 [Clostridia bacterium]|nr:hypothetical protein [Clostridia bacterium]
MFFNKNSKEDKSLRNLENEIKNHIDEKCELVPSFENIMSKCKTVNRPESNQLVLSNGETVVKNRKLNLLKIFIPILLLIVAVSLCVSLLYDGNGDDATNVLDKKSGYFFINVNPSLELFYDKDGNIKEATPLNEDAEIVLYNLDITNKNYREAIDLIVGRLIDLGYIEKEKVNAILTTAVNQDGIKDENMTMTIKEVFVSVLTNYEIQGEVLTGVVDEQLSEEAQQYGIDAQKLDLIKKLTDMEVEIPEEEYKTVTVRELYHKLSEREKEVKEAEKEKLQEENDKKKGEIDETVKTTIDFLLLIIGENSEYRDDVEEINTKYENGECTASEVITMLENLELGGFEMFLDMILFFKSDLMSKYEDYNKTNEELDYSNKTVEEKHNQRLENAKKDKGEEKGNQNDEKPEKPSENRNQNQENNDTGVDKNNQNQFNNGNNDNNGNNQNFNRNGQEDDRGGFDDWQKDQHGSKEDNRQHGDTSNDGEWDGIEFDGDFIEKFFEKIFG